MMAKEAPMELETLDNVFYKQVAPMEPNLNTSWAQCIENKKAPSELPVYRNKIELI